MVLKRVLSAACAALSLLSALPAVAEPAARDVFSAQHSAAALAPESIGSYAKGCLAGAVQLPADGPHWQAMRLSRDRRYGHPQLIGFLQRFSDEVAQRGIWPGLLVGDISQARGGPMAFGHASHQIGLDVDIWLQPMPNPRLGPQQREEFPFRSVLRKGTFEVDERIWNRSYFDLIKLAASEPEVERVFVHPGIKRKMCQTAGADRAFLNKVRPIYGHNEHFHIRLGCQPGSANCDPQASTGRGDGCDQLDWWFKVALQPPKPGSPPPKPRAPMELSALPRACRTVLAAPGKPGGAPDRMMAAAPVSVPPAATAAATYAGGSTGDFPALPLAGVPRPTDRPMP